MSVPNGESPAFDDQFMLNYLQPPPLRELCKESFQMGTTFGPQRCLN
jgi:hypothetical protein